MDPAINKLVRNHGFQIESNYLWRNFSPTDKIIRLESEEVEAEKHFIFSDVHLGLDHEDIIVSNILHDIEVPTRGHTLNLTSHDISKVMTLEMPRGDHHRVDDPRDGRGWYDLVWADEKSIKDVDVSWFNAEGGMLVLRIESEDDPRKLWPIARCYESVRYLKPISTPTDKSHYLIFRGRLPTNRRPRTGDFEPLFARWLEGGMKLLMEQNRILPLLKERAHLPLVLASWLKHLKHS